MTNEVVLLTHGTRDLNPSSGAFRTCMPMGTFRMASGPVSALVAERTGKWPVATGIGRESRKEVFTHFIGSGGSGHEANLAYARSLYNPDRGVQTLTFTMLGANMTVQARALRMYPMNEDIGEGACNGEWEILGGTYYAASASSLAGAAKTSTPATLAVSNAGTVPSDRLVFTAQPTAAKTAANGQRFLQYVNLLHRAPRDVANWPLELTGDSGWDHATEVAASRSLSTGYDVEVYVDGRRVPRWFGTGTAAANQSASRLWATLDLPAARKWTNATGASMTTPQTTFYTERQLVNIPATPFWAMLYDGTNKECVRVTAYDKAAGSFTIVRAQRGTSAAAHSSAVAMYWMPVTVEIVYGWTSATIPLYIDDRFKPIPASHASSTNQAWTFAHYQETDPAADTQARLPRPGSWRTARRPYPDWTGSDKLYRNWIVGGVGSPATTMQLVYNDAGAKAGRPLAERWERAWPIAISNLAFTQTTTTLTHDSPANTEGWIELRAVATDGTEYRVDTYHGDTASAETQSFSPSVLYTALCVKPWDPENGDDDNTSHSKSAVPIKPTDGDGLSVAAGMVATFDTAERIIAVVSSRTDAYQIGRPDNPATLQDATGNKIYFSGVVLALGDTLTVSVTDGTATVGDGTGRAHLLTGLRNLTIPADPSAPPYSSNLTYTEAGLTGGASITLGLTSYYSAWN